MTQNSIADNRMVWLDVVRCVAMLMVIGVHCIDPFYISPTMRVIPEYTHWAAIYGSLLRPSVPLFVMMTGLLLLPVKQQPLGTFYKKRIFRVLFRSSSGRYFTVCSPGSRGCWVCPKKSSATSSAILRDMSRKASSIL